MPNVIDLTTVALVQDILLLGSGVDVAFIQQQITAYSQNILTRTGRGFLSGVKAYTERYNGSGSVEQALRNYPILSVSSLSISGNNVPASPDYIQAGYAIDTEGGQSFLAIVGGGSGFGNIAYDDRYTVRPGGWGSYGNAPPLGQVQYRFLQGIQNVAVSYVAGYIQDVAAEAQTVPPDPGPYEVQADDAATFYADAGVTLASDGTPLTAVASSPGPMQYSVPGFGEPNAGTYLFNVAQTGVEVNLAYSYGSPPLDLQEAASRLVAVQYRRRSWLGQTSQVQPQIGTTAYSRLETELDTAMVIERYKDRRLP